jgi:hypothetical protein
MATMMLSTMVLLIVGVIRGLVPAMRWANRRCRVITSRIR